MADSKKGLDKYAEFVGGEELEALSLRHVWSALRVHKFLIGTLILASAALTNIYSFFATPEYRASVTVSVTISRSYQNMSQISLDPFNRDADEAVNKVNALPEYFRSPEVAEQILQAVFTRGYGPVPLFTGTGFRRLMANLGLAKRGTLTDALRFRSRAQVAADLMSFLAIYPDMNNTAVTIRSATPNAKFSAFLANTGARALLAFNHKKSLRHIIEVKQFLSKQESELGGKLKTLESELTRFQSDHNVISVEEAEKLIHMRLDQQEQHIIEAQVMLKTNERLISDIRTTMKTIRDNINNPEFVRSNFYLNQLQHRLTMLQYQQTMLQQVPNGKHTAEYASIEGEMKTLVQTYTDALSNRTPMAEASSMTPLEYYHYLEESLATLEKDSTRFRTDIDVLGRSMKDHRDQIPKLALNLQRINEIKRNILLTNELYLIVKRKLQETEIQEAGTIDDLSIVVDATPPPRPFAAPVLLRFFFSVAIGLFFALLTVMIREILIPTVRSRSDIEKLGLLVLGEIPLTGEKHFERPVVLVEEMPTSYEADMLRAMRLRLKTITTAFSPSQSSRAQVVQVTSPRFGNGKTFTAVNMAAVLARAQFKTLLIDMDLRRPAAHHYFGKTPDCAGLSDLDSNPKNYGRLITVLEPHLDVMFSGKRVRNPAEFLESHIVSDFVRAQRKNYDFIIIDSSAVMGVIDPVLTATMVDAVLLVVEHRLTLREDVKFAAEAIKEVYSKPLLGVLNCVHRDFTHLGAHAKREDSADLAAVSA